MLFTSSSVGLDVITNSLSSIADITSESGFYTAFFRSKGDVEETIVKASLAVLNGKALLK